MLRDFRKFRNRLSSQISKQRVGSTLVNAPAIGQPVPGCHSSSFFPSCPDAAINRP